VDVPNTSLCYEEVTGVKAKDISQTVGNKMVHLSVIVLLMIVVMLLVSCTPVTRYSVTMTSDPVRNVIPAGEEIKGIPLTIALFNDARTIADKTTVGQVMKSGNDPIPVVSANIKPASVVTAGVKSYMVRAGYTISSISPTWDLKPASISSDWGQFLLGGSMDQMEIICEKSAMKANYRTRVVLSIYLADVKKASIIHTYTVKGDSSREDVNLTDEDIRKHLTVEINNAVTDAIEKLIDPKAINRNIMGATMDKKP
jgi:hypothetical protein